MHGLCPAVIPDNTTKKMFQLLAFAVRRCLFLHLLPLLLLPLLLLLLLLLLIAVLAATAAVVLFHSVLPATAGSGAVFVQKTVCTRAVEILVVFTSR